MSVSCAVSGCLPVWVGLVVSVPAVVGSAVTGVPVFEDIVDVSGRPGVVTTVLSSAVTGLVGALGFWSVEAEARDSSSDGVAPNSAPRVA